LDDPEKRTLNKGPTSLIKPYADYTD